MRSLDRYVAKQVLGMIALVILVIVGIYAVFVFVGEVGELGKGNYGLLNAVLYVLFSIPQNLVFILPIASLLGTLIALGQLATHAELTAMRASGVSISRLALALLRPALALAFLSFVVSAFIAPFSAEEALLTQLSAKQQNRSFLLLPEATWLKSGSDFVFIQKSDSQGQLQNIVKYHFEKGQLVQITSAKEADFEQGSWHLTQVQELYLSEQGVSSRTLPEVVWPQLVPPQVLKAITENETNLTLPRLYQYVDYRKSNGLDVQAYLLRIWQIYAQPVSIIVLMLIGLPFAFGQLRSSTLGLRLAIGVALGLGFFLSDRFFGPFVLVFHWPPFLGAFLPDLLFLGLAGVLFIRLR